MCFMRKPQLYFLACSPSPHLYVDRSGCSRWVEQVADSREYLRAENKVIAVLVVRSCAFGQHAIAIESGVKDALHGSG
jgi:hypothetical protein